MIRKEALITRRRQLCQDMGRMAWPDEALAAREEEVKVVAPAHAKNPIPSTSSSR